MRRNHWPLLSLQKEVVVFFVYFLNITHRFKIASCSLLLSESHPPSALNVLVLICLGQNSSDSYPSSPIYINRFTIIHCHLRDAGTFGTFIVRKQDQSTVTLVALRGCTSIVSWSIDVCLSLAC